MVENIKRPPGSESTNSAQDLAKFAVDQLTAAEYAKEVINGFPEGVRDRFSGTVEKDLAYQLKRGLCLPSATAACINKVLNKRLVGDREGILRVGDFYRLLLPFHDRDGLKNLDGNDLNMPWWLATESGDTYHHAAVAFSLGLGVPAKAISDFNSVEALKPFLQAGGAVAISLDNSFVLEKTLAGKPEFVGQDRGGGRTILVEGPGGKELRPFENGRHVVALTQGREGHYLVSDSFNLPQRGNGGMVLELRAEEIDPYLKNTAGSPSRGIAFSKEEQALSLLESFENKQVLVQVPREVVEAVSKDPQVKLAMKQIV